MSGLPRICCSCHSIGDPFYSLRKRLLSVTENKKGLAVRGFDEVEKSNWSKSEGGGGRLLFWNG